MTATVTYLRTLPPPGADVSAELEDLAGRADQGHAVLPDLWPLVHESWLWDPEGLEEAWLAFREAAADRDACAPPATRDWRELRGGDYAATQEQAAERMAAEADEAMRLLVTGAPAWRTKQTGGN